MRATVLDTVEKGRALTGPFATLRGDRCGLFALKTPAGAYLTVLAGDGADWDLPGPPWEHVSVSLPDRCPTWDEMCWVKGLFWGPEDCVVQYHPPASRYVNVHPHCLHLWKLAGGEFPVPPAECVG